MNQELPFRDVGGRTPLVSAIDRLFSKINFETEAETLEPQNIVCTEGAFREFLGEMNWTLAKVSFNELMDEKSGDFALRDDGKTPNWYHEFDQVMLSLALIKSGKIDEVELEKAGGAEVLVSGQLRHDSFEDHGKVPTQIYAEFERDLHEEHQASQINDEEEFVYRHQATGASHIIDLMTRKIPVRAKDYYDLFGEEPPHGADEQGFVLKPNGKRLKIARYDGDLNEYHAKQIQHALAAMAKPIDGIGGVFSRIMPDFLDRKDDPSQKFSVWDNIKYAKERRSHYSEYPYAKEASRQHPQFREVYMALDAIMGIGVRSLETVNHYFHKDNKDNPYQARPIDIEEWVKPAREVLEVMPKGWRPDILMLERLENVAKQEYERSNRQHKHSTAQAILNHALYPAFAPLIGEDRRAEGVIEYERSQGHQADGQAPG